MPERWPHRPSFVSSLSARLLVLTVFFVLLAEFLIYAPSISRFRKVYMEEHVASAHLAALALQATPDNMVSQDLERELLFHAGAYGVVLKKPERRMLVLSGAMPSQVEITFDLSQGNFVMWIGDAFEALVQNENRVMRVIGISPKDPGVVVEVVMDEEPMRQAMIGFSARILQLSIVISLITASLVYLSLQWLMVRPMGRITRGMTAFRDHPEDASRSILASSRSDEIGIAQRELSVMQNELRAALRQKTRLATLGTAVAKINHDLRNSLATAMLVSDRLADIDDAEVQRLKPRLSEAIDRAVNLCGLTLDYVGSGALEPRPSHFHLQELITEVGAALKLRQSPEGRLEWQNTVDFELDLQADRAQLFRVLNNLCRNSQQAGATKVWISAGKDNGRIFIDISDDGPGLAAKAKERLFQPFTGSARKGGTGLGLVIVRDIMRAHGGEISLLESGAKGTTFRLELPERRQVDDSGKIR